MARVISDLPTYQYSVIEQGYIEGLLTSIISGEFSSADLAILELLEYLPLAADSGVSSDHDTETIEIASTSTCQGDDSQLDLTDVTSDAIDECNTKKKDCLIPPDNLIANKEQGLLPLSKKIGQGTASPAASSNLQSIEKDSISAGLHMYCNGDIIKMSDEESSLSFISKIMYPKNRKRTSSFYISDPDYHRKCVDLLWKSKYGDFNKQLIFFLLFRLVLSQ